MTDILPENEDVKEISNQPEVENPLAEAEINQPEERFENYGSRFEDEEEPEEDKALSDSPELFQFPGNPLIVPREGHIVSRKLIDHDALKVMYRLIRAGYKAFLVGGGVRDLLLSKKPKDFDIGTSASPEEVRRLFRNSRIIGRRFRMNQVYFRGGKIIEVATFRAHNGQILG